MEGRVPYELINLKLKGFGGSEFNPWKRKVQFGLKWLNVFYTVASTFDETTMDVDEYQWKNDDDFCRDYLLNCLSDRLAEVYSKYATSKEIWDNLDAQFKKEEELSKTHLVDKYLDFKFKDDEDMLPQVTDLENLAMKLSQENIPICERFLVGTIINKLPDTWLTFKKERKREKVQMGLGDLKRFIQVEDCNRARIPSGVDKQQQATANLVINPKKFPKSDKSKFDKMNKSKSVVPKPSKSESQNLEAKKTISKKKRKGKCHNCNKWGHYWFECEGSSTKSKPPKEAVNMLDDKTEPNHFVAMVGKGRAGSSSSWWLDSGATCHVTNDKNTLTELSNVNETVRVASGEAVKVAQIGTAHLTLSSENSGKGGEGLTRGENLNMDMDDDDLLDE